MSGFSFEYDFVHCAWASPAAVLPPLENDAVRDCQRGPFTFQHLHVSTYPLRVRPVAQQSIIRAE
jgi:hypothetical protein